MDYEMKQTIAIMKKMVADGKITQDDAEMYCPEMAESEDERVRKEILSFCRDRKAKYHNDPKYANIDAWISYLEKKGEQKPVEWSEYDERMAKRIYDNIQQLKEDCDCDDVGLRSKISYEDEQNWLKSLRHQKTWKPTEMQLKCLNDACDEHFDLDGFDPLYTLYEQLKAL